MESAQTNFDEKVQQLQQATAEQRSLFESRIESLQNELSESRTSLAEQQSMLKVANRKNANLETINAGLTTRVESTNIALSSAEGQVTKLTAVLDAEKAKLTALQSTLKKRIADKDQVITSLKQQVASKKKTRGKSS